MFSVCLLTDSSFVPTRLICWSHKEINIVNLFSALVEDMCQRYPNATAVNIYGTPAIHPLVMKAVSSLRYIRF